MAKELRAEGQTRMRSHKTKTPPIVPEQGKESNLESEEIISENIPDLRKDTSPHIQSFLHVKLPMIMISTIKDLKDKKDTRKQKELLT